MDNKIFADNFADERLVQEYHKYGRLPPYVDTQFSNPDKRHSIEPAYGNYDRPISGLI
jgi:hypothetical protein